MEREWGNEEEKHREWGNGERLTPFISSFSMHFQNVKYSTFVANVTKNEIILGRIRCQEALQVVPACCILWVSTTVSQINDLTTSTHNGWGQHPRCGTLCKDLHKRHRRESFVWCNVKLSWIVTSGENIDPAAYFSLSMFSRTQRCGRWVGGWSSASSLSLPATHNRVT